MSLGVKHLKPSLSLQDMEIVDSRDAGHGGSSSSTLARLEECYDSDGESYIEIALEPAPPSSRFGNDADETTFCISLSSATSLGTVRNNAGILPSSSSSSASSDSPTETFAKISQMREEINASFAVKLLIKLRSMNILRTVFEVFLRTQQAIYHAGDGRRKKKAFEGAFGSYASNLMKLFDRIEPDKNADKSSIIIKSMDRNNAANLEGLKGIFQSMASSINVRKHRRTVSCPSSSNCSPIHKGYAADDQGEIYLMDNSIKAAIAHCKSSLGRPSRHAL